jgi:hypothetical protein
MILVEVYRGCVFWAEAQLGTFFGLKPNYEPVWADATNFFWAEAQLRTCLG